MQVTLFIQSRLFKKIIAYSLFPVVVLLLVGSPVLGLDVAHAQAGGCNPINNFHAGTCVGSILAHFFVGINIILAVILYLIGLLLDFAIEFSITPGDLYRSDTINVAWTLLRDIINMAFIFILLYIAIGTVLNIQSVNWKKQVTQVVIAAILINFSLFITRAVIDAGNILAHSFYQEITTCEGTACGSRSEVGISERFMNALGIAQITNLEAADTRALSGWKGVGNALMSTITIIIAMWVFLAAAILFIGRTFALVFILVLSPIGIAGTNLPLLSPHAKKWREELFKQTMLGVVFLFFMFVILTFAYNERGTVISDGLGATGDGAELISNALGTTRDENGVVQGPESLFMMYVFVIAGLIMALRLTKSMSGQFGKFADATAKAIVGGGLAIATGGTAAIARGTVGRAAAATSSRLAQSDAAQSSNRFVRGLTNYGANLTGGVARSSMDMRTGVLGKLGSEQLKRAGFNVSGSGFTKAQQGGFIKDESDARKKAEALEAGRAEMASRVSDREAREIMEERDQLEAQDLVSQRAREDRAMDRIIQDRRAIEAEELVLNNAQVTIDAEQAYLENNREQYEVMQEALRDLNTREARGEALTSGEVAARDRARDFVDDFRTREQTVANHNQRRQELDDQNAALNERQNEVLQNRAASTAREAALASRRTDPTARAAHLSQIAREESGRRTNQYAERLAGNVESMGGMRRGMNRYRAAAAQGILAKAGRTREQRALDDLQAAFAELQQNQNNG